MDLSNLKNIKIFGLVTVLLMILAGIIGFMGYQPAPDPVDNFNPVGKWKVTEITGFINYKVPGGSAWCDAKNENYYPIIDDDQTFIKLLDGSKKPNLKNIPMKVFDTLNMVTNPQGLFIFQFKFDNGYDGNAVLESYRVPYHYTEVIKGLWTFEIGFWGDTKNLEDELIGKYSNSLGEGIFVYGEISGGNKWGGKATMKVVGSFKGENRIEGWWQLNEITAGPANIPECTAVSEGSGNWVAIKN